LFAQSLAVNYNKAWFYCYQFADDFNTTYHEKFNAFLPCVVTYELNEKGENVTVDENCSKRQREIFFSFLFNMLGNAKQLRDAFLKMNQSYTDHDTVTYFNSLGNVMRILYDFESFNVVWAN